MLIHDGREVISSLRDQAFLMGHEGFVVFMPGGRHLNIEGDVYKVVNRTP